MNSSVPDQINCVLDDANQCLHLSLRGEDRPGLISKVTRRLDECRLYVASMTFHLRLAGKETIQHGIVPFEMQIVARGDQADLGATHERISAEGLFKDLPAPVQAASLGSLQNAAMMQLRLYTPDRPGLTAMISETVAREPEPATGRGGGNFIHLLAATYNDGGPQGGTPFFMLCGQVAAADIEVARGIESALNAMAVKRGLDGDLQIGVLSAD